MAQQTYDVDAAFVVTPPQGLYNPNSSNLISSGTGTSALATYSVTSQTLYFNFFRQNVLIPNGSYYDPNVTYPVGIGGQVPGGGFTCSATNNRILVQGNASYRVQIITSAIFNVSGARVPQTFQAFGAASGVSGNGLYTSGYGWVQTLQPGYLRQIAGSNPTSILITKAFTFPIYLRQWGWGHYGQYNSDPINQIIGDVADYVKMNYIPEFKTDLLFV